MPAASADKRARQRANKLSQKELSCSTAMPLAETAEIVTTPIPPSISTFSFPTETTTPTLWPAPAPATFTISYTPLSISYPEPENPAAKLPTDAVRVTREMLALMLRQSYIHGSEHGWKVNVTCAKERLQADFNKDIQDATAKFAIHEKQIRIEEFKRGFKDGQEALSTQVNSLKERLALDYENHLSKALDGLAERSEILSKEEFTRGFNSGCDTAIRDESRHRESLRSLYTNHSMQTEPPEQSPHVHLSMQTDTPEIILTLPKFEPPSVLPTPSLSDGPANTSVSDFLSFLFDPFESDLLQSTTNTKPPLLSPSSFVWSDEPSEEPNLPPPPPISAPPFGNPTSCRDFSDLRSGVNPWQSLQCRKGRDRRRSIQPTRERKHKHQQPSFTPHFYSHRHARIPHIPYPQNPPSTAPLDWHTDPRLHELSRILRNLGWVHPSTARPRERFS